MLERLKLKISIFNLGTNILNPEWFTVKQGQDEFLFIVGSNQKTTTVILETIHTTNDLEHVLHNMLSKLHSSLYISLQGRQGYRRVLRAKVESEEVSLQITKDYPTGVDTNDCPPAPGR